MKKFTPPIPFQDAGNFVLKDEKILFEKIPESPFYQEYLEWCKQGNVASSISITPPIDERSEILNRLIELDSYLPRAVEDLYVSLNMQPYNVANMEEKSTLRNRLKDL